jgi:hypothetical protein
MSRENGVGKETCHTMIPAYRLLKCVGNVVFLEMWPICCRPVDLKHVLITSTFYYFFISTINNIGSGFDSHSFACLRKFGAWSFEFIARDQSREGR